VAIKLGFREDSWLLMLLDHIHYHDMDYTTQDNYCLFGKKYLIFPDSTFVHSSDNTSCFSNLLVYLYKGMDSSLFLLFTRYVLLLSQLLSLLMCFHWPAKLLQVSAVCSDLRESASSFRQSGHAAHGSDALCLKANVLSLKSHGSWSSTVATTSLQTALPGFNSRGYDCAWLLCDVSYS